jgi:hypothetical protein
MTVDQKKFDKLLKQRQKTNAIWKKTSKKYQEACASYHWTEADDGAKWKRALALRERDTAAFQRAETAFEALVAASRKR